MSRLSLALLGCLTLQLGCRTSSFQSVVNRKEVPPETPKVEVKEPVDTTPVQPVSGTPVTPEETPAPVPPEETPAPVPQPLVPTESLPGGEAGVVRATSELITEKFQQDGIRGAIDILIVLDNSDSMREEQENLSSKLGDLLSAIGDAKWQVGIINTTPVARNGVDVCEMQLFRKGEARVTERFGEAVRNIGVSGGSSEEGIRQAVNGLRCPQAPWVRKGSTVAVLIVSDEDNCSDDGKDCAKQPSSSKETHLIGYMEKDLKREVGVNAGFYGIFSPPSDPCPNALIPARQYQRLVDYKANNGRNWGRICDSSYKSTLEHISQRIALLLKAQFSLKKEPDLSTLKITGAKSNGQALSPDDYTIDGTTITFRKGREPALRSEITATYYPRVP